MASIYRSAAGEQMLKATYAGLLSRWPTPHESLRLLTLQGETFVIAFGDPANPPLVLLHGSGSNAAVWMGDAPALARRFRVYAVDVIGEPGFSAPSRPPMEGEAYAEWLDDVLAGLGHESAAFVGVSLGGWIALDYAIRRPAKVARLVLVCPGGIGRARGGFKVGALMLMAMGAPGRRMAAAKALAGAPEPVIAYISLIFEHFKPRTAPLPVFPEAQLAALAMPVMMLMGGKDALLDGADARARLSRANPRAQIVWLPDAGHVISGQTATIEAFLAEPASA